MRKLGMQKMPGGTFFLAAVLFAAVAGLASWYVIRAAAPSVPVLVAKSDLTPGTLITEEKLAVVEMPRAALPKDRVTYDALERVLGTHARTWVAAGDPVRLAHLSELRARGGALAALTALQDPELRGYALPPEAVEGLPLEPGDRVDLVGVMEVLSPVGGQTKQTVRSQLIVQGAPVLDVAVPDYEAPYHDVVVVVGLTPEQAERVALFEAQGKLKAQVRPADGGADVGTPGADLWTAFRGGE